MEEGEAEGKREFILSGVCSQSSQSLSCMTFEIRKASGWEPQDQLGSSLVQLYPPPHHTHTVTKHYGVSPGTEDASFNHIASRYLNVFNSRNNKANH